MPCSVQGNYLPVMNCHPYNMSQKLHCISPHATLVKNARKIFFVWGCGGLKGLEETNGRCYMGSFFTGALAYMYVDDIAVLVLSKSALSILVSSQCL